MRVLVVSRFKQKMIRIRWIIRFQVSCREVSCLSLDRAKRDEIKTVITRLRVMEYNAGVTRVSIQIEINICSMGNME